MKVILHHLYKLRKITGIAVNYFLRMNAAINNQYICEDQSANGFVLYNKLFWYTIISSYKDNLFFSFSILNAAKQRDVLAGACINHKIL
jgi:hypothetical protein